MVSTVIDGFLESEKNKLKLKSGFNSKYPGKSGLEILNDDMLFVNWWNRAAERFGEICIVTHNPKYTHSAISCKGVLCIPTGKTNDSYLHGGNMSDVAVDIIGAINQDIVRFLNLKTKVDGIRVYEDLLLDAGFVSRALNDKLCYERGRAAFLTMVENSKNNNETSQGLKQVYFPLGPKGDYHILSLLTNSGGVEKLKRRIDGFRSVKDTDLEDGEKRILVNDLTSLNHGGSQAQNIGAINSICFGVNYLLDSSPPVIKERELKVPVRDFFKEVLWYKMITNEIKYYHGLLVGWRNNYDVRNKAELVLLSIVYRLQRIVKKIREQECGWSNLIAYKNLPHWQKVWLDDYYVNEREQSVAQYINECSLWIMAAYDHIIDEKELVLLSDPDLAAMKKLFNGISGELI